MMEVSDQRSLLTRLIGCANTTIARPSMFGNNEELEQLAPLVRQAAELAIEHPHQFIGAEATMLVTALARLEAARRYNDDDRAMRWSMVAGVLLPLVRRNLFDAMTARPTV